MIHVIATISIRPGKRDEFLAALKANVPNVLAEEGCLGYSPAVDLETDLPPQIPLRENAVTIVEAWESLDHLRAHLKAPHMLEYKKQVKDLEEGVSLQVLEQA